MPQRTYVKDIREGNARMEGKGATPDVSTPPGGKSMRDQCRRRMIGHLSMALVMTVSFTMLGCNGGDFNVGNGDVDWNDGSGDWNGGDAGAINAVVTLTADNAAALGGLRLMFAAVDGVIFGFPNEQVLLTFSADGTRYTLETGTTMVIGAIAFAFPACTLTDDGMAMPRLAAETCNADVWSTEAIPKGGSGGGEVTLQVGQDGQEVVSAPTVVTLHVADNGDLTLNGNRTPILDVTPGATLPPSTCICAGLLVGAWGIEDAFACAALAEAFECKRSVFATQPELCFGLAQCCTVSDCARSCSCPSP